MIISETGIMQTERKSDNWIGKEGSEGWGILERVIRAWVQWSEEKKKHARKKSIEMDYVKSKGRGPERSLVWIEFGKL